MMIAIIIAIILYLVLGATIPYFYQPGISKETVSDFSADKYYADDLSCDRATVLEDNGDALTERIKLINNAKTNICMSSFDFRNDTSGMYVMAALYDAADRGVQVKIIMDGFNSYTHMENESHFYALASHENIEIRIYNKINVLLPWRANSRMHDKYLIADDNLYILGGRNIFDYFLGDQDGYKNYDRDVLVYNTGGGDSSLYQVYEYFESVWNTDVCKPWHNKRMYQRMPAIKNATKELKDLYLTIEEDHSDWLSTTDYNKMTLPVNKITLISNPTHLYAKEPVVFYELTELMKQAKDAVWIHTPYIMCSDWMYERLEETCEDNTDINIITNSALNNGNPFGSVDYILNKQKILDTGLNIWEYNGGVSYHAKSITIDDDISVVGSFNMDMKSTYQDTELMLVINGEEFNSQLTTYLENYQKESSEGISDPDEWKTIMGSDKSLVWKMERRLLRLIDPLLRDLF